MKNFILSVLFLFLSMFSMAQWQPISTPPLCYGDAMGTISCDCIMESILQIGVGNIQITDPSFMVLPVGEYSIAARQNANSTIEVFSIAIMPNVLEVVDITIANCIGMQSVIKVENTLTPLFYDLFLYDISNNPIPSSQYSKYNTTNFGEHMTVFEVEPGIYKIGGNKLSSLCADIFLDTIIDCTNNNLTMSAINQENITYSSGSNINVVNNTISIPVGSEVNFESISENYSNLKWLVNGTLISSGISATSIVYDFNQAGSYTVMLMAEHSEFTCTDTDQITVNVGTVSIDELSNIVKYVQRADMITTYLSGEFTNTLFNINGSIINSERSFNSSNISTLDLPSGIYLLQTNKNGMSTTKKFFI